MAQKNTKQFGVWMDSRNATIVGKNSGTDEFAVLGHAKNPGAEPNTNENTGNNHEIMLTHKFFKEILSKISDADEIHLTGTGQIQEQFIKYLAETPQYKSTKSTESTSNKMSDEKLVEFIGKQFN
jgi:stalled ribosome rescue protein Dom34